MWADPKTCLTVRQSGLPEGRKVQSYLFAPPYARSSCTCRYISFDNVASRCIADAELCKLSSSLIHSFVYSKDIVSRLSLGSVRDMTLAASWLCEADEKGNGEGYAGIARRALMTKAGYADPGNADWVRIILCVQSMVCLLCCATLVPFYQKNPRGKHANGPSIPSWASLVGVTK
jgi:sn1-specific diacylglycerol lipase